MEKLNCKSLMIGDWVEVPFFEGKPKIVKVEEILSNEINPEWDGMENYGGIKIKYVNPIPLTPEILEKNGFKYNPFGSGFWEYKTEDGNISCTKLDYWLFYINDHILPNYFNYVHELQHALKLCGIEKNIII